LESAGTENSQIVFVIKIDKWPTGGFVYFRYDTFHCNGTNTAFNRNNVDLLEK